MEQAEFSSKSLTVPAGCDYSWEQRLDLLKMLYSTLHTVHREDEKIETKATFAVCTLMLALSAYLFKNPIPMTPTTRSIMALFVIGFVLMTVWFLIRNSRRIRNDCRLIVRAETALGFYEEDLFLKGKDLTNLQGYGDDSRNGMSLFPLELQKWGVGDDWLSLTPSLVAVVTSGLAALLVLVFI